MKKNNRVFRTAGIITIAFVAVVFVLNPFKEDIWDINADKFVYSVNKISGDAYVEDLNSFIPFDWDELYSFAPYTPKEVIYEVIGYKWDYISQSVNEGMNQMVFVKEGKVVCYIYGYPDNNKIGFDFGEYEDSYIRLTPNQRLSFATTISDNQIRYFKYINEPEASPF